MFLYFLITSSLTHIFNIKIGFCILRLGRHFLQLQASIEVLRMLEIPEVFHSFAPSDYVELFAAATVSFVFRNEGEEMIESIFI